MLTATPITMMIQAEEQAKRLEQNTRLWAEEMRQTIPSERPTSRWLTAIGNFAARLGQNARHHQPTVTPCCVEKHSCAHA